MNRKLLCIMVLCSWMASSFACTCIRFVPEDYCKRDIIFRGTATAEGDQGAYTFRVNEIFWANDQLQGKYAASQTVAVSAGGPCGSHFVLNTSWVIAAWLHNGNLTTGLCAHNQPWDEADQIFFLKSLSSIC